MTDSTSNSKKVSLNALFLYMRTAFSMVIQLIAVRYMLLYLGEDGYGLYGLIGSIVIVVSSLTGLLSSSVQRYLSIAIGKQDREMVKEIFNSAILIHLIVSIILVSITIVAGLIILPGLDIPPALQSEARLVLIFSALAMGVDIIAVPFTAMLMAYEKFNIYAILCIIEQTLKLVIVLSLILFSNSRVAIYSALLLGVYAVVRVMYVIACRRNFGKLVAIGFSVKPKYLKELSVFSGIRGIGIVSDSAQNTGVNFIINIFGGLIANSARAIAYQVLTAVSVLVWNINFAFNPRIMTLYGEGNMEEYELLIERMTKFTFLINMTMSFAICSLIYPILNLWLGQIPTFTPLFIVLVLCYAIAKSFFNTIDTVFTSQGKVKGLQVISVAGMAAILIGGYVVLKAGHSIYWSFGLMAIVEVIMCIAAYILAARTTRNFNVGSLVRKVVIPASILLIIYGTLGFWLTTIIPHHLNIFALAGIFILLIIGCALPSMKFLLSQEEFAGVRKVFKL